jgi:hypothetical protein
MNSTDAYTLQDNAAREAMMVKLEQIEGEFGAGLKNPWKWRIRKRIWVLPSIFCCFRFLQGQLHVLAAGFNGE